MPRSPRVALSNVLLGGRWFEVWGCQTPKGFEAGSYLRLADFNITLVLRATTKKKEEGTPAPSKTTSLGVLSSSLEYEIVRNHVSEYLRRISGAQ